MNQKLATSFKDIFQTTKEPRTFFAPGRINLIGEHTDYNGGRVFPAAISYGTYALVTKRSGRRCRFYSLNFPNHGVITVHLNDLDYREEDHWTNYAKGMLKYIQESGHPLPAGLDIFIYGTIPNGAGLSSSASLELVTAVAVNKVFEFGIDLQTITKLGQKVENDYIGVQSGMMDQFAIGYGKKDHALLLNCETLEHTYAPLPLKDHQFVIMHTNKQRTLADSAYNDRRNSCEEARDDLKTILAINHLCELTPEQFETHQHTIRNDVARKRAKHVVYENARTLKAYDHLQQGDLISFGQLMNESHVSLRDDFEVTGRELDQLVDAAWKQEGVLGARMTGAGFGGCAIALVEKKSITKFIENVGKLYLNAIGYEATFYDANIVDGVREIKKEVV